MKKDAFLVHLFVVWWKREPLSLYSSRHKTAGDNSIELTRENLPLLEQKREEKYDGSDDEEEEEKDRKKPKLSSLGVDDD